MDYIYTSYAAFSTQVTKEGQYITWLLVLIGWVIAGLIAWFIARWQEHRNAARSDTEKTLNLKQDLVNRVSSLEDQAIDFWMTPPVMPQKSLDKFTRDLKTITSIAKNINKTNGQDYPSTNFISLRRAVTLYKTSNISAENYQGHRIQTIRDECAAIRKYYF